MKYIINIPDKAIDFMGGPDHFSVFVEPECKVGDCKRYALRLSKEYIEPYTEPNRKAIEDEVWEFVSKLVWSFGDKEILGMSIAHAVRDMTYQEAKSKYEAWKAEREQIRVGDEVALQDGNFKYVVMGFHFNTAYLLASDGSVSKFPVSKLRKLNRHFNETEELLKKMREGKE